MNKYFTIIAITVAIFFSSSISARQFRVAQLPNGSKSACATCHVSPNGGGSLNKFGQIVGSQYLSGGNVTWNSSLAALDSDGDGYSNGTELGDPKGEWKVGLPDPSTSDKISNPGITSSIPASVLENLSNSINKDIKVNSVYPNPVSSSTEIKYELKNTSMLNISVYNSNGVLVKTLFDGLAIAGENSIKWNLDKNNGFSSEQGIYLLIFNNGFSASMEKIYVIK